MRFLTAWGSKDHRHLITFSAGVLKVFEEFRQEEATSPEAGGILLGHVRGDHLEVVEATRPTAWDRRLRYLFERFPQGHELIAKARWVATGGNLRYLGEWHTHPESTPNPSGTDLNEWAKKVKSRKDERPMLAVIVGTDDLHVRMVPATSVPLIFSSIEE